jgi:hypothetical protein
MFGQCYPVFDEVGYGIEGVKQQIVMDIASAFKFL